MTAQGLAWREGVQEGLAVEVTCGRISHRYTGCQALSWRAAHPALQDSGKPSELEVRTVKIGA